MPPRRRIAATVLTLAFAAYPAAALAQQGAGDEQYTDPFAGNPTPSKTQTQTQSQQAPSTTQQAPSTTQQAPSTTQQAPATTQPSTTAQATVQQPAPQTAASTTASSQLPRTGFDLLPVALGGLALLAAGLALRRRAANGRD